MYNSLTRRLRYFVSCFLMMFRFSCIHFWHHRCYKYISQHPLKGTAISPILSSFFFNWLICHYVGVRCMNSVFPLRSWFLRRPSFSIEKLFLNGAIAGLHWTFPNHLNWVSLNLSLLILVIHITTWNPGPCRILCRV